MTDNHGMTRFREFRTKLWIFIFLPLMLHPSPLKPDNQNGRVVIRVDTTRPAKALKHVWPYFGFDECNFASSPNAKQLMQTIASANRDPAYIRSHFLLNTGDGTPALKWGSTNAYTEDAGGNPVYDWEIMDQIMDAVVTSGCIPLVEIGFMPQALSIAPEPYQHTYPPDYWAGWAFPPKDYSKWAGLIRAWAAHSRDRYGEIEREWWWELWNEPDIFYWQGTFEEYCRLFDVTEQALHAVLPGAMLGGPHTTGPAHPKAEKFLRDFLEHCLRGKNAVTGETGTRLDFVGFHSKGSTKVVDGHPRMNLGLNLKSNQRGFAVVAGFPEFRNTPIIIGECDPEGMAARSSTVWPANGYRNGSAYAAYEIALMKHTLDLAAQEGVNLRGVLTWAFMFDGKEYFEGFRTLATNGIHKPVLNAFKMLGMLRGKRLALMSSGALGKERIIQEQVLGHPDVDGLAVATEEMVQVLVWNYHDDITPGPDTPVRIEIAGPSDIGGRARIIHYRIDHTHSNAFAKWESMGSPKAPTPAQRAELLAAGELETLGSATYQDVADAKLRLDFDLPRHGVSLIEILWPGSSRD